jgi:hypothetical protein
MVQNGELLLTEHIEKASSQKADFRSFQFGNQDDLPLKAYLSSHWKF